MQRQRLETQRLMTIREVAERLALSPLTLYSWVATGKIAYRRVGRQVRFTQEDVDGVVDYVEAKR